MANIISRVIEKVKPKPQVGKPVITESEASRTGQTSSTAVIVTDKPQSVTTAVAQAPRTFTSGGGRGTSNINTPSAPQTSAVESIQDSPRQISQTLAPSRQDLSKRTFQARSGTGIKEDIRRISRAGLEPLKDFSKRAVPTNTKRIIEEKADLGIKKAEERKIKIESKIDKVLQSKSDKNIKQEIERLRLNPSESSQNQADQLEKALETRASTFGRQATKSFATSGIDTFIFGVGAVARPIQTTEQTIVGITDLPSSVKSRPASTLGALFGSGAAGVTGSLGVAKVLKPITRIKGGEVKYIGYSVVKPTDIGEKVSTAVIRTRKPVITETTTPLKELFGFEPTRKVSKPRLDVSMTLEPFDVINGKVKEPVPFVERRTGAKLSKQGIFIGESKQVEGIKSLTKSERSMLSDLASERAQGRPIPEERIESVLGDTYSLASGEMVIRDTSRISPSSKTFTFFPQAPSRFTRVKSVSITKPKPITSTEEFDVFRSRSAVRSGRTGRFSGKSIKIDSFTKVLKGEPKVNLLEPDYTPQVSDDIVTLYQGTTEQSAQRISQQGLKSASQLGITRGIAGESQDVFATVSREAAEGYANRAALRERISGKASRPAVIEIKISRAEYERALREQGGIGRLGEIKLKEVPKERISIAQERQSGGLFPQEVVVKKQTTTEIANIQGALASRFTPLRKPSTRTKLSETSQLISTSPLATRSVYFGQGLYERTEPQQMFLGFTPQRQVLQTRQTPINILKLATDTRTKTRTRESEIQIPALATSQIAPQKTSQDNILLLGTIQPQKLSQETRQLLRQDFDLFQPKVPRLTQTPRIPRLTKPPITPRSKDVLRSLARKVTKPSDEFGAFGRVKGKDVLLGTFKSKKQAELKVKSFLKGTLGASGVITKGKQPLTFEELESFGAEFSPSKRSATRVVQRRSFRLATQSEVSSIQRARRSKSRNWLR